MQRYILTILIFLFPMLNGSEKKATVLVLGGAGYIGSLVNKMLHEEGYDTIVLDNLSTGTETAIVGGHFIKGDIGDSLLMDNIFANFKIDAVMHFAASKEVNESVENPSFYYKNNVCNTLNLLDCMVRHSVNNLIFSSSAAIFGEPQTVPIKENHPCNPQSPYGYTKMVVERILSDYGVAYGLKYCNLRYFNAAGADPEGKIKNTKQKASNLIPIALNKLKKGEAVEVFGTDYSTPDGSCIRDYVHIYDIGQAHILAMRKLLNGGASDSYNLGCGKGFSVKEVLNTIQKVTGKSLKIIYAPRRKGDVDVSVADSQKAQQELGWKPIYNTLNQMIEHTWNAMN